MSTEVNNNIEKNVVLDLKVDEDKCDFSASVFDVLYDAKEKRQELEEEIKETTDTIDKLTPQCDKLDYALAMSVGALCGVMDIFLVGKPGESPLGDYTDKWFENRVIDFANFCDDDNTYTDFKEAEKFLEKHFKVPYDQSISSEASRGFLSLTPKNHRFKSMSHHPSILGLFCSIMDQFSHTSHFAVDGEIRVLRDVGKDFVLKGSGVTGKIFCGFKNWLGHLISDVSKTPNSKGRGMGIPSPLWTWVNDVSVIKDKLDKHVLQNETIQKNKLLGPIWSKLKGKHLVSDFDRSLNDLAIKIYEEGYDLRFTVTQAIPVFINEIIVRLIYSIRRMIQYYKNVEKKDRSWQLLWKTCEPFSNSTVKRMLTVSHGTFCLIDLGDATIRSFVEGEGKFDVVEFVLRANIVGVGRFSISLYGEAKRGFVKYNEKKSLRIQQKEKLLLDDYIEGLEVLCDVYNDNVRLSLIDSIKNNKMYKETFIHSVELAIKRDVPEKDRLDDKKEIDNFFTREDNEDE